MFMIRKAFLGFLVSFSLVVLSFSSLAAELHVSVKDAGVTPLNGAQVSLISSAGKSQVKSTKSGMVVFKNLNPRDTYRVQATKAGYSTDKEAGVRLKNGYLNRVKLTIFISSGRIIRQGGNKIPSR